MKKWLIGCSSLFSIGLCVILTACSGYTKKFNLNTENIEKEWKKIGNTQKCMDDKSFNDSNINDAKNFLLTNTQVIGICFGYLYYSLEERSNNLISINYFDDRLTAKFIWYTNDDSGEHQEKISIGLKNSEIIFNGKKAKINHIIFNPNDTNLTNLIFCETTNPDIFMYIYKLQFPKVTSWPTSDWQSNS